MSRRATKLRVIDAISNGVLSLSVYFLIATILPEWERSSVYIGAATFFVFSSVFSYLVDD